MNIKTFFGVPFYHSKIHINDNLINFAKTVKYQKLIGEFNGSMSENTYILNLKEFYDLKKEIDVHSQCFFYDILKISRKIKFNLKNSWLMKHELWDRAHAHVHVNSMYSGVVYLQVDKNTGHFSLHDEKRHRIIKLEYDEDNEYNSDDVSILPEKGSIFLFPSSLEHSVQKNESNIERYCLSFDFFPEGFFSLGEISNLTIMSR